MLACLNMVEIKYTSVFEKQYKKLGKKYKSLPNDLKHLIDELKANPVLGTQLGGNIYKVRLGISAKGKGKRGGGHVVTYYVSQDNELHLVLIYDKSEISTVPKDQIVELLQKLELL